MAPRPRKRAPRKTLAAESLSVDKIAWLVLLGLVVLVSAYVTLSRWATVRVPAAVVESQIIALTNSERTQNDVGTLAENALLDKAAQDKANDMAAKGYFSHVAPDGTVPWAWFNKVGYDYHYAGENLAVRFDDSQQVVTAWMNSPTHRANIVKSDFTEIGVGVAQGMYQGQPATFVVQFFGTPQDTAMHMPVIAAHPVAKAASTNLSGVATHSSTSQAAVLGASVLAPVSPPNIFTWVFSFLNGAWRTLTASAIESQGGEIGTAANTER